MARTVLPSGRGTRLHRLWARLRGRGAGLAEALGAIWDWAPTAWGLPRGLALFLLVFALGMLAISLVGDQGLIAYWMLRSEEAALRSDVTRLEAREAELVREIEALRSDPAYIEQVARRQLGFVRPGEVIVQLPAPREER
jgi:cell division protein FtsB